MTALTVDGFDAAKVSAMIDTAPITEQVKTTLKSAVDLAGKNPDMIPHRSDPSESRARSVSPAQHDK